jgi:hypothetical protein
MLHDMRFEIILYSQYFEATKPLESVQSNFPLSTKFSRILECRLLIDPVKAKLIAQWHMGRVNAFEQQYGIIPTVDQQQKGAGTEAEDKKKTTYVAQHPPDDSTEPKFLYFTL